MFHFTDIQSFNNCQKYVLQTRKLSLNKSEFDRSKKKPCKISALHSKYRFNDYVTTCVWSQSDVDSWRLMQCQHRGINKKQDAKHTNRSTHLRRVVFKEQEKKKKRYLVWNQKWNFPLLEVVVASHRANRLHIGRDWSLATSSDAFITKLSASMVLYTTLSDSHTPWRYGQGRWLSNHGITINSNILIWSSRMRNKVFAFK